MKNRFHHILVKYALATGLLFSLHTVYAQQDTKEPMSAQDRATKELARMKGDLALTSDQEAKLKPILLSYAEKKQQAREAAKAQHQTMQTQKEAELKNILTAEQYQKLMDKKKEFESKRNHDGHGHHGGQKEEQH